MNITTIDYDVNTSEQATLLSLKGDFSEWFTIDSIGGRIVVSKQGAGKLDREKYETIHLKVRETVHVSRWVPGRFGLLFTRWGSSFFLEA